MLTAYLLCPEFVRDEEAGGHRLLAEGDQIGRREQVEVLVRPPAACRTEAGLHFVYDERHLVLRVKEHFGLLRRSCNTLYSVFLNTESKEPSCK